MKMSLVSIIATEKALSVLSDGRAIKDGVIVQENFQKFEVLGNGTGFVAITGWKEAGQALIQLAKHWLSQGDSYYVVAQKLQKEVLQRVPYTTFSPNVVNMSIGGLSEGHIGYFNVSNKYQSEDDVISHTPTGEQINYSLLSSTVIEQKGIDLSPVLVQCLQLKGFQTTEQMKEAQILLNNYVADIDPTVNKSTFHFSVKKP
jgi:hypothetical protein